MASTKDLVHYKGRYNGATTGDQPYIWYNREPRPKRHRTLPDLSRTCLSHFLTSAHSHFHKRGHPLQKDSMLRTFTSNNKSMVITLWKGKMYRERVISLIININNEINGGVWNCATLLHGHEGENNYKCLS